MVPTFGRLAFRKFNIGLRHQPDRTRKRSPTFTMGLAAIAQARWLTQRLRIQKHPGWFLRATVSEIEILCDIFQFWNSIRAMRSVYLQLFFTSSSGMFDRQDSLRSDYLSDRETRYGIVQQASIDSTDSRLCYLTSSEVCSNPIQFTCAILRNSSTSVYIKNEKKKS